MEEQSLRHSLKTKQTLLYTIYLFIAIVVYQDLGSRFIFEHFPYAITISMFFVLIFSYLLQRSFISKNLSIKTAHLLIYSLIMLLITTLLMTIFNCIKLKYQLEGYDFTAQKCLHFFIQHLKWYGLFGVPSIIIARIVCYFQFKNLKGN